MYRLIVKSGLLALALLSGCRAPEAEGPGPFIPYLEMFDLDSVSCENAGDPLLCEQEKGILEAANEHKMRKLFECMEYQDIVKTRILQFISQVNSKMTVGIRTIDDQ